MKYVLIGKIVSTHGIKGEIKIKSDFEFKDKVFTSGSYIYIGNDKKKEKIISYRSHKGFDMVLLGEYNNINQVLQFMGCDVYFNKDDLNLRDNQILDNDLIGLDVILNNEIFGQVVEVFRSSTVQKVIRFKSDTKSYLVPYVDSLIKIDGLNKRVILNSMEGVLECE